MVSISRSAELLDLAFMLWLINLCDFCLKTQQDTRVCYAVQHRHWLDHHFLLFLCLDVFFLSFICIYLSPDFPYLILLCEHRRRGKIRVCPAFYLISYICGCKENDTPARLLFSLARITSTLSENGSSRFQGCLPLMQTVLMRYLAPGPVSMTVHSKKGLPWM